MRLLMNRMKVTVFSIVCAASCFNACNSFVPTYNGAVKLSLSSSEENLSSRNAFSFDFGLSYKTRSDTSSLSSSSEALIEKAKDFVNNKSGFYSNFDAGVFAEDFVFRGPYVGPLNKNDYLATMDAFGIYRAFPDIESNAWGFSIDPKDPNRVWFMVRNSGTFDGEPLAPDTINFKPNGSKLEGCPETFSILFDEEQKVKYLSVGYVADRFEGNTAGQGAAMGIFNVIGLPLPKVGPVFQFFQFFLSEIIKQPPLSYSTDIPEWWTNEDKAIEGYL